MSLISPKNFIAPLTNKVHLITIVLVAVAFTFLRLSGGSIALEDRSRPTRQLERERPREPAAAPVDRQRGAQREEREEKPKFEGFTHGQKPPWERDRKEEESTEGQRRPRPGLDDIEATLGLR